MSDFFVEVRKSFTGEINPDCCYNCKHYTVRRPVPEGADPNFSHCMIRDDIHAVYPAYACKDYESNRRNK
jgi:hypothetical protein